MHLQPHILTLEAAFPYGERYPSNYTTSSLLRIFPA